MRIWARGRVSKTVYMLAVLGVFYLVGQSIYSQIRADTADQAAVSAQQDAKDIADPVAALCAKDAEVRKRLGVACQKATEVQQAVIPPVMQTVEGRPGRDGIDGRDGRDGRDGTSGQSPPCLTEPRQCRGEDGTNGSAGVDGQSGRDGVDGQPGKDGQDGEPGEDGKPPASWTWTDSDGREQSCTRSGGPDTAPTYTCTAEPPPPATPTTTPLFPPS